MASDPNDRKAAEGIRPISLQAYQPSGLRAMNARKPTVPSAISKRGALRDQLGARRKASRG